MKNLKCKLGRHDWTHKVLLNIEFDLKTKNYSNPVLDGEFDIIDPESIMVTKYCSCGDSKLDYLHLRNDYDPNKSI